jgi:predicted nucleic acid-binding protein
MTGLVADTSGLVSLGIAGQDIDLLSLCLERYDVAVPEIVVTELREVASYDDVHGDGAGRVLDRAEDLSVQPVDLDPEFPLDDGENAAVTLANEDDAAILLCDEFNRLGLIHASLADTRLVTTPTLLSVFVRQDRLASGDALALLDTLSEARSWDTNSYVQRTRSLLAE